MGGAQGRTGRVRKISPPPGLEPRTVQPIVSHYNDYAIPAHSQDTPPFLWKTECSLPSSKERVSGLSFEPHKCSQCKHVIGF